MQLLQANRPYLGGMQSSWQKTEQCPKRYERSHGGGTAITQSPAIYYQSGSSINQSASTRTPSQQENSININKYPLNHQLASSVSFTNQSPVSFISPSPVSFTSP